MEQLGFRSEGVTSVSDLALMMLFLAALILIAFLLRKKKDQVQNWFGAVPNAQGCQVSTQKVDNQCSLYRVQDETHHYLVMRAPEGLLLLNKEQKK